MIAEMWGVYSLLWDTVYTIYIYIYKSAKLEQLILYFMHFNCEEVVLKSN